MAYSFDLLGPKTGSEVVRRAVASMEAGLTSGWASWAFSNHDVTRAVTRWGREADREAFGPLSVALVTSLRGTACVYQGEELALTEADIPFEKLQDPYGKAFWPEIKGRDGCRTPMPWTSDPDAGFSTGEPWLPVAEAHRSMAVSRQAPVPGSARNRVRRFLAWRRQYPVLARGSIAFLETAAPVIAFIRRDAAGAMVCVFNPGDAPVTVPLPAGMMPRALDGHGFAGEFRPGSVHLPAFGAAFGSL